MCECVNVIWSKNKSKSKSVITNPSYYNTWTDNLFKKVNILFFFLETLHPDSHLEFISIVLAGVSNIILINIRQKRLLELKEELVQSGGRSDSYFILWNRPFVVFYIFFCPTISLLIFLWGKINNTFFCLWLSSGGLFPSLSFLLDPITLAVLSLGLPTRAGFAPI